MPPPIWIAAFPVLIITFLHAAVLRIHHLEHIGLELVHLRQCFLQVGAMVLTKKKKGLTMRYAIGQPRRLRSRNSGPFGPATTYRDRHNSVCLADIVGPDLVLR